jgi:hypothetical protein
MSYDFQLLPRGEVDAFLQRYEEQDEESEEINPGPIIPEREAWKRQLRDAIVAEEPQFTAFLMDYAEVARLDAITEAEARVRYRHIELNLLEDDGTGIQITIFDDTVSLTVPYWHQRAAAEPVFRRIWRYLRVLERAGDLATHDPQVERVLDLAEDFETVLNRYLGVMVRMPEILAQAGAGKKPWWKFW